MSKLKAAEEIAIKAHEGQFRKLSGESYVVHPIAVAKILHEAGLPEDIVIAGFLHDTVEDTALEYEDIEQAFGLEVVRIVKGNTEDKTKSWDERKQNTVEYIKNATFDVKALIVADKLDNLKSLIEYYESDGDQIWEQFKGNKEKQSWYYRSVAENALIGLEDVAVPEYFHTYKKLANDFFGKV
ncbi:HD domain-containing protein [Pseudalkalibacillus berkeleyi]|uniref:HD domain-containing protein n=1 Tax=Pseudalkalibacillus berkeleyi TaxID=1069813 RepID=A0ABS9H3D3_9BACL|nr:HD domain-containing protein [Pseudalkalibacillus berkeleyi]MCF6138352.1 HD domain-containing protein [Pseudalkalibacillus berkeleyi]